MANKSRLGRARSRITTGLLVSIPALVTFWVIEFTLELAVASGEPLARLFAGSVRPFSRDLSELLVSDGLLWAVAITLMLALFYLLGTFAQRITGKRILDRIERWVLQVPVMNTVYGAVRELIATVADAEKLPGQRVVLISFPHRDMKTIGFVTRTFTDMDTGRELAAVYVPTTPNPTSGYVEIVHSCDLVWLDWEPQQAIRFVVSGGAVGPETIRFHPPAPTPPAEAATVAVSTETIPASRMGAAG